ncbi:MAG TPA: PKD domain-containing protein, partial [Solirubrobacterales bacterium]
TESGSVTQAATKPRGGTWTAPVNITAPGYAGYSADVAVDPAGNAVAVWRANKGPAQVIQTASMSAAGTWGPAENISPGLREAHDPAVDLDPAGNAVAAWYAYDPSNDAIVEAARKPAGGPWGGYEELSDGGEDANAPAVAAGGAGAVVAWRRDSVTQASIGSPGPPWAKAVTISAPGEEDVSEVRLDYDGAGNVVAVWTGEPKPAEQEVRVAKLPAGGGAFGAPQSISASGIDSYAPEVALNAAGAAAATWEGVTTPFPVVQGAVAPVGAAWPTSTPLSLAAESPEYPSVAIDADGNALTIWRAASKPGQAIQAAAFDATGPEIGAVTLPKRPQAGRALSFSATVIDDWSALGPVDWSFGDGGTAASGPSATHSFKRQGRYTVTIAAVDAVGNTATATATVVVGRALAKAKKVVPVRKGKARLALRCPGTAVCSGGLKLTLGGAKKKKQQQLAKRSKPIGKAKFTIRPGKKKVVAIKLKGTALDLLRDSGKLRARLSGNAVEARAVTLKPKP